MKNKHTQLILIDHFDDLVKQVKKNYLGLTSMLMTLESVIECAADDEVLDKAHDVKHKLECIRDGK